jgi:steroid delta-isomerase-like uncharacterized protein
MKPLGFSLLLAAITLSCVPPTTDEADSPSSQVESNKQVVIAMMEAINRRELDALERYVASDVVRHSAATPGVVVESLEQFRAFLEADLSAVPDSVQTLNLILGEGDLVAIHATYAGTQTRAMGPFPPSDERMEIPFVGILRFADGKIAEIWVEWDNLSALAQLGHFPPPGGATDRPDPDPQ